MRTITQLVFSLNFVYQLAIGIVALFFPIVLVHFYGGPEFPGNYLAIAFRAFGACTLFASVLSAYLAINPDRYPVLLRLAAVLAAFTLVSWAIVYFKNELPVSVMVFDLVMQCSILIITMVYHPRNHATYGTVPAGMAAG
jgi:hypothetical protein